MNGNLSNANINTSAAIVASKLDLTAPNGVGTTTPAAGKFTTLEATSTFKIGSTNQGDVFYDNGTSIVRLTPGTSGQFLKTQGASANPTWASQSNSNIQIFTSSGTFTAPTGITKVYISMCSAGGGGGKTSGAGGGAGGGGGYVLNYPYTVVPASGYTVTINAGGAGKTGGDGSGASGGTTVFDTLTITGGAGGTATTGSGGGGQGLNASGGIGGGPSQYGGTGSDGSGNTGGSGGGTPFGVGALGVTGGSGTANSGAANSGGGGAGGSGTRDGGSGGTGIVIVMY